MATKSRIKKLTDEEVKKNREIVLDFINQKEVNSNIPSTLPPKPLVETNSPSKPPSLTITKPIITKPEKSIDCKGGDKNK